MAHPYFDCKSVTAQCPVENSIYGYYPNEAVNLFFALFFGICTLLQLAQGFYWRAWNSSLALAFGCVAECIGYVGRLLLHSNPFSDTGFEMQICCLIVAPAFLAAGIYLTLRHLVDALGPHFSPIQAKWYPWIFISCDVLSLVLQAAGGATAATSKGNQTTANAGGHVMLAGIVWQVFTLVVFAGLVPEYFRKVYSHQFNLDQAARGILTSLKPRLFLTSAFVAFATIFMRIPYH